MMVAHYVCIILFICKKIAKHDNYTKSILTVVSVSVYMISILYIEFRIIKKKTLEQSECE